MTNPDTASHVARQNMVASQVRTNKVWDMAIVDAMETIPREAFVPKSHVGFAYMDEDIDVGGGRIVMEPMIMARMIQALELDHNDVVLEIACGTGFGSAIMSKLAKTVIAVESDSAMVDDAQSRLIDNGFENVAVMQADVTAGVGEAGSADAILINGCVEREPTELLALLAEGGRLICPMLDAAGRSQVHLFVKYGESVSSRVLFDANVPLLPEFRLAKRFQF